MDDLTSTKALAVIARCYVDKWEHLRPFLDLSRQQQTEISRSYPADYGLQKQECLEVWKEMKGTGATYRALITAAEEAEERGLVDNIKKLMTILS